MTLKVRMETVKEVFHCFDGTETNNVGVFQISWVRRRDWHILTSGMFTYTNDERFQVLHSEGSDDWTLQIKYVQKRDNGTYECQVSDTYLFVWFLLSPFREQHVSAVPASMIGPSPLVQDVAYIVRYFRNEISFAK